MVEFTQESIVQAIELINQHPDVRKGRESIEYDLLFEGKHFPPILVLSEASKILGGSELKLSDFNNSTKVPFKILNDLGFEVIKREEQFYEELQKFLTQAFTNELKTSHYLDNFRGLRVKVSFGQGSLARVPWIAFLGGDNTVSNGIYPVYLFFKTKNLLILAYGLSETNKPMIRWPLSNQARISDFFAERNLGFPERYGESYVFASYNTLEQQNPNILNNDINKLIDIYKTVLTDQPTQEIKEITNTEKKSIETKRSDEIFDYNSFSISLTTAGLFINKRMSLRFVASLLTKPFVILTGLSGSGKTKLAQSFAIWLCKHENQYCVVPVGADWTNREPLLGFPNALKANEYVKPDNRVLDIIIDANKNPQDPYFIILDEMNLSHVERYFADFLSVMESKTKISLHSESGDWNIPSDIQFPQNLFVVGTVNIDETTYMFSPKVLDRASVIEFRVTESELDYYMQNYSSVDIESLRGYGSSMAQDFVSIAKDNSLPTRGADGLRQVLTTFFRELKKAGAEFGYRTASEILRFAAITNKIEPNWSMTEIIDASIMQKLLPKVHGSKRKLEPILKTLGTLCLQSGQEFDDYISPKTEINYLDQGKIRYPTSLEKILRMYQNLISNSFTSYAEA